MLVQTFGGFAIYDMMADMKQFDIAVFHTEKVEGNNCKENQS